LIVVDNGSPEMTRGALVQLAAADRRIRLVEFAPPVGMAQALQTAIELAQGDVLLLTEAESSSGAAELDRLLETVHGGHDLAWVQEPGTGGAVPEGIVSTVICALPQRVGPLAIRRDIACALPIVGELYRVIPRMAAYCGARCMAVQPLVPQLTARRRGGQHSHNWRHRLRLARDLLWFKRALALSARVEAERASARSAAKRLVNFDRRDEFEQKLPRAA
jgi:glycosyltransferase involved in cell wall biosynthesis